MRSARVATAGTAGSRLANVREVLATRRLAGDGSAPPVWSQAARPISSAAIHSAASSVNQAFQFVAPRSAATQPMQPAQTATSRAASSAVKRSTSSS
jgi:hypothetical protein